MTDDALTTADIERLSQILKAAFPAIFRRARSRQDVHNQYQELLLSLAQQFGFVAVKEFKLKRIDKLRLGSSVDIVWQKNETPVLAIEIDSSKRQKSLDKLAAFENCFSLWVHYGGFSESEIRAVLRVSKNTSYICVGMANRKIFRNKACIDVSEH